MHPVMLFKPVLHGATGYWDEIINLIPLVIGAALLLYLYLTARRRKPEDKKDPKQDGGNRR